MALPTPRLTKSAKRYPASVLNRAKTALPVVGALLVLAGIVQSKGLDPTLHEMHKNDKTLSSVGGLNNEFLLLPLLGFREAAAGLLWVRCDEFFHSGDYDAILPLVRLITWLDPHADNIYVTGAWHLAYNFTDSSERSDRRYIAPSQALLTEGIINNPTIPDIAFEKGWQNYDKIKDFPASQAALEIALRTPPNKSGDPKSDEFTYGAPLKVLHTLAHCYEKQGRIPEAIAAWDEALRRSAYLISINKDDYGNKQLRHAEEHNREEDIQRFHDRYCQDSPATPHNKAINTSSFPAVVRPPVGSTTPGAWDVAFKPSIEVVRPKVLKIKGQFNSADGARIDVRITDWDYQDRPIVTSANQSTLNTFDVDQSQTILVDSISVRKNLFEREMDMSKDPKMYSFTTDSYRVVLSFNCRTTSPHIHDRFGWSGEGITDTNTANLFADRDPALMSTTLIEGHGGTGPVWDGKTVPGFNLAQKPPIAEQSHGQARNLIRVVYKVTKAQIEGRKPITDADIVPNA